MAETENIENRLKALEDRFNDLLEGKLEYPMSYGLQGVMTSTNFKSLSALQFKGGFPVFSETPTYNGKQGEIVLVDDESDLRQICTYLNGTWRCQNITRSVVRAYLSSDDSITGASTEKLEFNAESFDLLGEFDSTTNFRFTPKNTGYYLIMPKFYSDGDNNSYIARIYKTGANYSAFRILTTGYSHAFTDAVYLVAGTDYIEIFIENPNVGAKVFDGGASADATTLTILRMD